MNRILLNNFRRTHVSNCRLNTRHLTSSRPALLPPRQPILTPTPVTSANPPVLFPRVRYVGPTLYGIALCTGSFVIAGTLYDRNQQTLWDRIQAHYARSWSFFGTTEESVLTELWQEKRKMMIEKRRAMLDSLARRLDAMQIPLDIKRAVWIVGEKWSSMTEAERTLAGLIGINTVVFALWQVPRLKPFMARWFLHLPGSRQNITLLTSCFSHQEFFHFTLNMVGLWSFGKVVHDALGQEQFLAAYIGAGVGANVVSHVASLALRRTRPLLPSLGASGAIYSLVASTAVMYPHSSISLIFLPMIPIQLGFALPALMAFDAAGILFKWRMFDHFAHLAGAGLGIAYLEYGEKHLWAPLVQKIHKIRQGGKDGGNDGNFLWTEPAQPEQKKRNAWPGWFNK